MSVRFSEWRHKIGGDAFVTLEITAKAHRLDRGDAIAEVLEQAYEAVEHAENTYRVRSTEPEQAAPAVATSTLGDAVRALHDRASATLELERAAYANTTEPPPRPTVGDAVLALHAAIILMRLAADSASVSIFVGGPGSLEENPHAIREALIAAGKSLAPIRDETAVHASYTKREIAVVVDGVEPWSPQSILTIDAPRYGAPAEPAPAPADEAPSDASSAASDDDIAF